MAQPRYLFKPKRGAPPQQTDRARALYVERLKPAARQPMPDVYRVVESTGDFDRSRLELHVSQYALTLANTAKAVKPHLRLLRDQEAEELDRIDAEIAQLRDARTALAQQAWDRGWVVPIGELRQQADDHRERVQQRKGTVRYAQ